MEDFPRVLSRDDGVASLLTLMLAISLMPGWIGAYGSSVHDDLSS